MRAVLEHLTDDDEAAFLWWGQSNARPWGHRGIEGWVDEPDLKLDPPGLDITIRTMAPSGATHHGLAGSKSLLTVAETLIAGELVGGEVRLWHAGYADPYVTTRIGYGVVTANTASTITVQWSIDFLQDGATVTFSNGTDECNLVGHSLPLATAVVFTGTVPAALAPATTYYAIPTGADTFQLAATLEDAHNGVPIALADDGSGTITVAIGLVYSIPGYVHLQDRWKGYENVRVLTPYQPEQPGDYPAGAPAVPGYSFTADIDGYQKTGLFLDFAWGEGIDGPGASGTSTATGATTMTATGAGWVPHLFAGGFVRCGNSKAKIVDNTSEQLTIDAWVPSQPPATSSFLIWVGHHRNNPHHFDPGQGFRYPSNDMQPGGLSAIGKLYNRPAGILTPSYVTTVFQLAAVSATVNAAGYARCAAVTAGAMVASEVGGQLRIQRADTTNDPATGKIQFDSFLVPGYAVQLSGWTINAGTNINTLWRVVHVTPVIGGSGSWIDLAPIAVAVGTIDATCTEFGAVDRYLYEPQYRFGALLPFAYRMAQMLGRRVNMIHLGVNGTSLMRRHGSVANGVCYNGKLGWWDDDAMADWTPSNPGGLAARLKLLVSVMAPAAIKAEGSKKALRVLGVVGLQGEADSMSVTGRELYYQMLASFYAWLRAVVSSAGLSPYSSDAKLPVVHQKITHTPWELVGTYFGAELEGDENGLVNAAIQLFADTDGFAATWQPDDDQALKLDGTTPFGTDHGHFNGHGEVINARTAANLMLDLVDRAFACSFALGPSSVALANQALALLGEEANVTSLDPPNGTAQARLCAQFMAEARNGVLQSHPWTFATRRVSPVALTNTVSTWSQAYAVPTDLLLPTAVLDPEAADDLQVRLQQAVTGNVTAMRVLAGPLGVSTQPYKLETEGGIRILRTNQASAVLVYTSRNVDFALWDPLVRQAAAFRLAHLLAGGLLKGKIGAAVSLQMLQASEMLIARAASQDAEYGSDVRPEKPCPWLPT